MDCNFDKVHLIMSFYELEVKVKEKNGENLWNDLRKTMNCHDNVIFFKFSCRYAYLEKIVLLSW